MKRMALFAISIFLMQALTIQLATACDCKPRTPPKELDGTITKAPTYEFSWYSDADKKEFLADISSFANTAGGDLILQTGSGHPSTDSVTLSSS